MDKELSQNELTNEDAAQNLNGAGQDLSQSAEPDKKVKAKFGVKPFAFFSGFFDICISAYIFYQGIMILISMLSSINSTGNVELNAFFRTLLLPFLIIICLIFFTGGILFAITGIITLVSSFKSDRRNHNGLLIAVTVFDALLIVSSIFIIASNSVHIEYIIFFVVMVIGFIFKIVDIVLTKKRLKKYNQAKMEEHIKAYQGPNFDNLRANTSEAGTAKTTQNEAAEENSEASNGSNGVDFSKLRDNK